MKERIVSFNNGMEIVTVVKRLVAYNNPLPHMPLLGSSNSASNKDMMSIILTNGCKIFEQFLLFPQCFQKLSIVDALK